MECLPGLMLLALMVLLMIGFPVTFTLMGTALCIGLIGFGWDFFNLLPLRIWGVLTNVTLLAVPTMLRRGYQKELVTGTASASGTLGQIILPIIVLVLISDIVGVPVGELFIGAVFPGMVLVGLYVIYIFGVSLFRPQLAPSIPRRELAELTLRVMIGKVFRFGFAFCSP